MKIRSAYRYVVYEIRQGDILRHSTEIYNRLNL